MLKKNIVLAILMSSQVAFAADNSADMNDKITQMRGTIDSINGELTNQRATMSDLRTDIERSNSKLKKQIFDELKARGLEDVFFISMDGVSGLEEGAKAIFPNVVVQRCIVHLIRNSIKYIPSKDYKKFTQSLKRVYGAVNLKAAQTAAEGSCPASHLHPPP